jgi:hypothetical protein
MAQLPWEASANHALQRSMKSSRSPIISGVKGQATPNSAIPLPTAAAASGPGSSANGFCRARRITKEQLLAISPSLADKIALRTTDLTVAAIAEQIAEAVREAKGE